MKIMEFNKLQTEQVKDLLVELQKYVIEIDKYNLNIISPSYRDKYFDFMIKDCLENDGKVFVAVENNNIIGMIAGYIEKYSERDYLDYKCPKKGIIAELIVSKASRSGGTGSLLLEYMEKYFKEINCKFIQIDVFAYNQIAEKFYNKHGYENRMLTMFKKI